MDRISFTDEMKDMKGVYRLRRIDGAVTMSDEELSGVTGGFGELNSALPTSGYEIICPRCGNSKSGGFSSSVKYDKRTGSVEYSCNCGCDFICYEESVILKADWVSLCNKKEYKYPY